MASLFCFGSTCIVKVVESWYNIKRTDPVVSLGQAEGAQLAGAAFEGYQQATQETGDSSFMCDLSEQGQTFLDRTGGENTIAYSVPTPLGYRVYVSRQRLQHVRNKHRSAAQRIRDIPQILAHPDIIVPDYDQPDTHLYYKTYGQRLLVIVVHVHLGRRYLATMHWDMNIKGSGRKQIASSDFLYVRGGFKWKKWR